MNTFVPAIVLLAVLGIIFGAGLAIAARKLAVKEDPRIDEIEAHLPGANCGACGFPGCRGLAEAIVNGSARVNACPVNKDASPIAKIMNIEVEADSGPKVARVRCAGGKKEAKKRFTYVGIDDCTAAHNLVGGFKVCEYGCLGLGSCAKVCPFGGITINENGLPEIDEERCTGCGLCVKACPREIIAVLPADTPVMVACRNPERGAGVKKACSVGCIGCGICAKQCPQGAITMEDNLPVINQELCTGCGICVSKCPVKAIKGNISESKEDVG